MNTNEIITPDIVRRVLGIEDGEQSDTCSGDDETGDCYLGTIELSRDWEAIHISCCPHLAEHIDAHGGISCNDDEYMYLDIHRFIYLAIEKCAAEGYWLCEDIYIADALQEELTGKVVFGDMETQEPFEWGGDNNPYPSRLHAQLAAIAWVYGKMKEGK